MSFDWNRARALLATAEEGSFSAAARALGTSQPTIGRQIAALEEELGVVLFERVGRGLRLTSAGVDLVSHVRVMGEAATRIALVAAGQSTALEGLVKVTASETITAHLLPPIVAEIQARYPGIELELVAANEARDLRQREADIAVRNFRPRDPELRAVKVQDGVGYCYASEAYLARIGGEPPPDDLRGVSFFAFDHTEMMREGLGAIGLDMERARFPVVTSNHLAQWEMCKAGLGICVMMEEVGAAEPSVRRLFPTIPPLPVPMWVVSHRELTTTRRMRVVFDLLVDELRAVGLGRVAG